MKLSSRPHRSHLPAVSLCSRSKFIGLLLFVILHSAFFIPLQAARIYSLALRTSMSPLPNLSLSFNLSP